MGRGRTAINLLGKRYGRLLVIARAGSKNSHAQWLCRCDCGQEKVIDSGCLRNGFTKSCGCLQRERRSEIQRLPDGQAGFNKLYHAYEVTAIDRDLIFDLTKEDVSFLTQINCFYCNCPPGQVSRGSSASTRSDYTYNGIDRIEPNKGYTMDNVVACCKWCNFMKRDMTISEFKQRILDIVNHRNWTDLPLRIE